MAKTSSWWMAVMALGAASTGQAADHPTLTIGLSQFPTGFHPNIGSQDAQSYTLAMALRRVTAYDAAGHVVCLMCIDVPTLANGLVQREGAGLSVTIKLKPDLAWGDGVPVTARDLAFTWKLEHDPAAGFSNVHPWSRATSVDVVDDHTAVLHLDRTYTSFDLWDDILSEHIEGPVAAAAATPAEYINRSTYNREPTNPGLWNGPYVVASTRINESVSLTPNPHWAGTKPGFQRINVRLVDNTAALQANLLSGDVDMTPAGIGVSIDQAMWLERDHSDTLRLIYKPGLIYEHLETQFANPTLRDQRVREALLRGVDVKAVVDRLFGGHAEIARSFINDVDPHYITDVPAYAFDPARARALLDEAGWKPGPDQVRRNAAGERLSLEFVTTSGNRVRELTQQVMQSQWRAIGVEVVIRNQPARTFFGQVLKRREFTGLAEFASTLEPGLVPWSRLSSPFIPSEANNWAGQNYAGIQDSQMDEAVAAAQFELDPARQQALWATMQRVYASKLLGIPLYFRAEPDIVPRWLAGYEVTGKETWPTFLVENWRAQ